MFAPPLLDGLASLGDVAAAWAVQGLGIPEPLPLATVKPMLAKERSELMRYQVCQTDLQKFYDELNKISEEKDKEKATKDAQEYIAKFAGTQPWKDKDGKDQGGRGLKIGSSTEFRDLYTMVDDPGLEPLVKLWKPFGNEYKD